MNDKMVGFDSTIRRKSPLNEGFTGSSGNSDAITLPSFAGELYSGVTRAQRLILFQNGIDVFRAIIGSLEYLESYPQSGESGSQMYSIGKRQVSTGHLSFF